eukprot:2026-Heterococcus_DN1.PRE.2
MAAQPVWNEERFFKSPIATKVGATVGLWKVIDSLSLGVWDLCLSTGVGLRNEHVFTMYGFEVPDPAAAVPDKAGTHDAQQFREAVHPDDVDKAHSAFMQALSSPTGSYDMVSNHSICA